MLETADKSSLGGVANNLQIVSDGMRKLDRGYEKLERSYEKWEQKQEESSQIQKTMQPDLRELTDRLEIQEVEVPQDQGATELGFLPGSAVFRETTSI